MTTSATSARSRNTRTGLGEAAFGLESDTGAAAYPLGQEHEQADETAGEHAAREQINHGTRLVDPDTDVD